MEEVVLGGYRRLNVMQTGQNSEIWQVADVAGPGQMYAMKLLLPERNDDRAHQKLLKYEAGIAIKLQHPNLIRTIKFGRDKGHVFILMEYFASRNLKLRLMRKEYEPFIKPRLRMLLSRMASALDYVHSQGFVHRDVKPDNMLVDSIGGIRLIDFALAVKSATKFQKRWGRRKTTAGTRSYMSPEQIKGLPVDFRADIYSFGVLIFELVSGRVPFTGMNGADLLRKHLNDPPPSLDRNLGVTPEFDQLMRRMLAKKEDDRLGTMAEFQTRLKSIKIYKDEQLEDPMGAAANARVPR